jgi:hypothetical protein
MLVDMLRKMGLGELVDMEFNITGFQNYPRCSVAGDCLSLLKMLVRSYDGAVTSN